MSLSFKDKIKLLTTGENSRFLNKGLKGLEKESLRITQKGSISKSPHPKNWGSALTNPHITTDYSEALPEFITPPFEETDKTFNFLKDIHTFAMSTIPQDEILWNNSMPCRIIDDKDIPIAKYGNSNAGRMRHIYRVGLDYRYGRRMQAIAGIHFNYSLPKHFWEFGKELFPITKNCSDDLRKNFIYLSLARNYLRFGWLILLLFGSSPACCKSYLPQRNSRFKSIMKNSLTAPHGTSLRMSDVGYKNKNQSHVKISFNSLEQYIGVLIKAMKTPYPEYEAIGIYGDDKQIQLSANLLQIENEYYSCIRPKGVSLEGQRPTVSLQKNGIDYIEMRSLDVNPFNPFGIERDCLLFCEIFLIFCLLEDSPLISDSEYEVLEYNELSVALRGRQPNLTLLKNLDEKKIFIRDWSDDLLSKMIPIGEALDHANQTNQYSQALKNQQNSVKNPDLLPSARFHQLLIESNQEFQDFNFDLANQNMKKIKDEYLAPDKIAYFESTNNQSQKKQHQLEAGSKGYELGEYIKTYLSSESEK